MKYRIKRIQYGNGDVVFSAQKRNWWEKLGNLGPFVIVLFPFLVQYIFAWEVLSEETTELAAASRINEEIETLKCEKEKVEGERIVKTEIIRTW
ncbi:MAG: hypothetical protein ABL951_04070 [Alphaproteobacteria bacterium]